MKLLSVALARAIWHLDTTELNPGGRDLFTELVPALIEHYEFKTYPKAGGDFKEGMKFMNGVYTNRKGDTLNVSVTMWSDGIVADVGSATKDAEEFLEEAMGMLPELGFEYEPSMVQRKAYLSQLNVRCSKDLNVLNPKLANFAGKISSVSSDVPFGFAVIEFWPDQMLLHKPANFSFQKKQGEPLSGDRYWSQAGLPTDKHLELLNELEILLT